MKTSEVLCGYNDQTSVQMHSNFDRNMQRDDRNEVSFRESDLNNRKRGETYEISTCIDIHNGKVKQIVGGSLRDEGDRQRKILCLHRMRHFLQRCIRKTG